MKQFKFSLQVVLNLKKDKEERAKIHLGQLTLNSDKIKADIEKHKAIMASMGIASCIADAQALELYKMRLSREIVKLQSQWLENETKRQQAAMEYAQAVSEVKAYEKLREKKYHEYKKLVAKEENRQLDELNQIRRERGRVQYGN